MKPFKIITGTRSDTVVDFHKRPLCRALEHYGTNYPANLFSFYVDRANDGLSNAFNRQITKENKNQYLIFCHDDLELEDLWLFEKLESSPYDVTVLAGATEFDTKQENLAWHLCARRECLRGEVAHTKDGNVWTTCFGPQGRVLTFDGLFIAAKCSTLLDAGVTFEESFKYHFYDLAFALSCHQTGLKCGTLPIRVVHHGLGDSMHSEEWKESNKKFRELYCK